MFNALCFNWLIYSLSSKYSRTEVSESRISGTVLSAVYLLYLNVYKI